MAEIEQNAGTREFAVSDLRGLPRAEIENMVMAGLLPEETADEVFSEQNRQQQENQQPYNNVLQSQTQSRKEKRDNVDDYWLENMSLSYQEAYHQLMDTYDDAQREYGDIKTRAEKLKEHLREEIKTAYQFGVQLPDGRVAFYDRHNGTFVDASLHSLQADDAKTAAEKFNQLPANQQRANACYVDACHAYAKADSISQAADVANAHIAKDKVALENSNGEMSEQQLREWNKEVVLEENNLSQKLTETNQATDDLSAALSESANTENSIPASRNDSVSPDTESKFTPGKTSFASTMDGSENGKTSLAFNAAVVPVTISDNTVTNDPAIQFTRQSAAPVR